MSTPKDHLQISHVILDLDQTLTVDQGSWLQFTRLIGADSAKHQKIYMEFKDGALSYEEAKQQLIHLWRDVSNLKRSSIKEVFKHIQLRDGAIEAVSYLRSRYRVCIISGAIDVFVEVIAKRIKIDTFFASTHFIFNDEDVLQDFDYTLSRGEEKLTFLHKYCNESNISLLNCAAIGDGESDMPIFNEVAYPILFIADETTQEMKDSIKIHLTSWNDIKSVL